MKVLVTGTSGQVVSSLREQSERAGHTMVALGRPELDLSGPISSEMIAAHGPDVIVSAAAYTAVDKAESEPDLAFSVNAAAPGQLAAIARTLDIPIVHLSTDYVFDGTKASAYVETDPTGPRSVYGASKLAGEQAVIESGAKHAILRTAWVYSPFGNNFLKTMLRLAADRDEIRVVSDQHGTPTSALDIATGILQVAANLVDGSVAGQEGVFHMVGQGEASWADFAEAIFKLSGERDGPTARVVRIGTTDYPTPAARPGNSRLVSDKLARLHHVRLPFWQESTRTVIERLLDGTNTNNTEARQ